MNEQEKADLVRTLEDIVLEAVPRAQNLSKYGGTLYTLQPDMKEGQFCGLFAQANHVQLAFSQGAALCDPENMLTGKGKLRRHINVENIQDIDKPALMELLKAAAKFSIQS